MTGRAAAASPSASSSRDFPTPASPLSSTTRPAPRRASSQCLISCDSSRLRPISGTPRAARAWKRVATGSGVMTRQAAIGAARPLTASGCNGSTRKWRPISSRVGSSIRISSGFPIACSRAARLGVRPTASVDGTPSVTISLITTWPVLMPIRARSGGRPRPAEISDDAVAAEIADVSAESDDGGDHRVLVGRDQLAQLLRIEPVGKLRRAHQVAKQHRHPASLGRAMDQLLAAIRLARRWFRRGTVILPECASETLAVAEAHAERGELGLAELGEDIKIDAVRGKRLRITVQFLIVEPGAQIARHTASLAALPSLSGLSAKPIPSKQMCFARVLEIAGRSPSLAQQTRAGGLAPTRVGSLRERFIAERSGAAARRGAPRHAASQPA